MPELYGDIDSRTPCIFVLSTGADPTAILLRFAAERRYSERTHIISLGQGQGPRAEALIATASETGDWVVLQNCHLIKSWMTSLEDIVIELAERDHAIEVAVAAGEHAPRPIH